jgi:hypothetical protein
MTEWMPTHWVPEAGLEARPTPDPAVAPVARLDPWLEVAVAQVWGDWAQVVCANGWWAWVDGRVLVPRTAPAPSTVPSVSTSPATGGMLSASFAASLRVGWAAALGGVVAAVSGLLPWFTPGDLSRDAFDVPVEFLYDYKSTSDSGLKVGLLLLVLGGAGALLAVLLNDHRWRRGVGIAITVIAGVYVVQLQRLLGSVPAADRPSLLSSMGFGVYVALVGGLALAVVPNLRRPVDG